MSANNWFALIPFAMFPLASLRETPAQRRLFQRSRAIFFCFVCLAELGWIAIDRATTSSELSLLQIFFVECVFLAEMAFHADDILNYFDRNYRQNRARVFSESWRDPEKRKEAQTAFEDASKFLPIRRLMRLPVLIQEWALMVASRGDKDRSSAIVEAQTAAVKTLNDYVKQRESHEAVYSRFEHLLFQGSPLKENGQ